MMDKLLTLFLSMRWQDFVDIALNSYILFRFYVLFRGTNVFRVLIGMTILWFFQRIAVSFGLIVTSWVVQGVAAVAALIIIVVFRNEIRSVLQARNLRSILWGLAPRVETETISVLVDSVYEMAQNRIGALIVLPGKEDLQEEIQSGIAWKGQVSKEMVKSIFWPGNPVHDGAAIIRGNQVTEVGAILPLSKRDDLPSSYGTRHRAALGLAESTDALVIAVSEERGEVVVCKGSRYQAIKQKKTLEQRLREHIGIDSKKMPIWRSEKVEIASAALLSFIFITAIWLNVSRGQDTLVNLDVPIGYMNLNPEMEIVNASVNTVSLKLSASAALMRAIRPEQLQVNLDLGNAKLGENAFLVTSEDVSLPPGIELKSVTPSEIFVYLDDIVSKELPVQVDWVGQLPDDLIMVSATVQPERVKVMGGQQALESLSTIYTEKIALDNLSGEGSLKADLVLQPASLKIASNSKEKITIKYTIQVRDQM